MWRYRVEINSRLDHSRESKVVRLSVFLRHSRRLLVAYLGLPSVERHEFTGKDTQTFSAHSRSYDNQAFLICNFKCTFLGITTSKSFPKKTKKWFSTFRTNPGTACKFAAARWEETHCERDATRHIWAVLFDADECHNRVAPAWARVAINRW